MDNNHLNNFREIEISPCAINTINPVRLLVDTLQINPNPDKEFLKLSIGDPSVFGNFDPPPEVLKAVSDVLKTSCYGYAPAHGSYTAREAIAEYYTTENSPLTAEDIYITSGCSDALRVTLDCLGSSAKSILLPCPSFPLYKTICGNRGIPVKYYNLKSFKSWSVDLEDLEAKIDEDTAAILVTNPSNPCGSAFTVPHQQEILKIAEKHRIPIIADEIYQDMVYEGESKSFGELSSQVPIISCGGLAKRWLVPGWRVGWIIVHDRHNQLTKVRDGLTRLCQVIIGSNTIVQSAIPQILSTTPQSFYDDTLHKLKEAAELMYTELRKIPSLRPIMPQGAMYMMVEIKVEQFHDINSDKDFVEKLISEQSVFPLPADMFGAHNYMRLVLTVPGDVLKEACSRIAQFCQDHSTEKAAKRSCP